MKKNVASQVVGVQMVSASDGSAFTSAVTCVITGDGGTQSASGGTGPTHEGNGFHTYLPTQAETNYDHVAFTFTGTGAVPATVQVYTSFPQTGDSFARVGAPAGASVSADIAAVKVDAAAILVDTGTDGVVVAAGSKTGYSLTATTGLGNQTANITGNLSGSVGSVTGAVGSVTGLTAADVAAIKAKTDNLPAAPAATGDIPTAAQVADAIWDEAKSGHTTAGTYGQHFGAATESATINDAGATTTSFVTTLASAVNDHYNGRVIIFTSGTLLNQATDITDYVGATKTVTVTALTSAPANGVSFIVV